MSLGRQEAHDVVGFEQLTSLAAAAALNVPERARVAYLTAEGQPVRFRDDGTNPTAAIGHRLVPTLAGAPFLYAGDLKAVRFIEEAVSAKLNVTYLA